MNKLSHSSIPITGIRRWLITISVMLVAVIEVLDMTIVNVALSPMMGTLGATRDQITWVLTSYIVSAAIVMPLTGFLVDVIGRRKLLLTNIVCFMVSSVLCGLSTSLTAIVFFRVLQGVFGAGLIPLSQYIMIDTYSLEERGKAMAIWGMGVMVGPILGPTLGGYITDYWNWRWIFFINIPVCLIAFLMAYQVIEESPIKKRVIDWTGLFWLVVGVGCLQIMLDRGNSDDWFESKTITFLAITSFISLVIFIKRGIHTAHNIINLKLFWDYNFTVCCVVLIIFTMGLFSVIAIQPLMMQQLLGYSPTLAGLAMAPRGLTSAIAMILVAKFISKVDPRIFLSIGLVILSFTSYKMSFFHLHISFAYIAELTFLQGFGVGFFFVPLSTMAFSTLKSTLQAEASGLFNFSRNLGTSIGISVVSTYIARASQGNWNNLAGKLTPENAPLQMFLQHHHWNLHTPKALAYLIGELGRQASMISFVNTFYIISMGFLCALPFIFLLKKPKKIELILGE